MFDMVKKSMLAGIGLALKTWDEVEELVTDIQKKSDMSESEGRKFLDEARKRYGKLEKHVEDAVKNFLKKTSIVTTDELKELKKEIRELKSIVNAMTKKES